MRNKEFFDSAHAQNYLSGAVIKLGEEPIYVSEVTGNSSLSLRYCLLHEVLTGPNWHSIGIKHKDIDMTAFPLGYINWANAFGRNGRALRSFRSPLRSSRIGLSVANLNVLPLADGERKQSILFSMPMVNTIKNKFPSYEEAYSKTREAGTIAFSRRFALNDEHLFYLQEDVAIGRIRRDGPELFKDFAYFQELLDKDMAA